VPDERLREDLAALYKRMGWPADGPQGHAEPPGTPPPAPQPQNVAAVSVGLGRGLRPRVRVHVVRGQQPQRQAPRQWSPAGKVIALVILGLFAAPWWRQLIWAGVVLAVITALVVVISMNASASRKDAARRRR
jgi:hypothetical protein